MNATDTRERILAGFSDLLERLRSTDDRNDTAKRIKSNTRARLEARIRVWHEWNLLGLTPPSDDALSITALRELGYVIPQFVEPAEESAA